MTNKYTIRDYMAVSKIRPKTHENSAFLYNIIKNKDENYLSYLNDCLEFEKFNNSEMCFERETSDYIDLKNIKAANDLYVKMINESNKPIFKEKYRKFLEENKNEDL